MRQADTNTKPSSKPLILGLGVVAVLATTLWVFFGPSAAHAPTDATAQKAEQLKKSYGEQPIEELPPPPGPRTRGARSVGG
jgi:hypothetical protein